VSKRLNEGNSLENMNFRVCLRNRKEEKVRSGLHMPLIPALRSLRQEGCQVQDPVSKTKIKKIRTRKRIIYSR
jgi:hypothetical protein